MSWKLKRKAQALIAQEEGLVTKDWGGKVRFALVYPNTYSVGMSNLGFQTIYHHLNLRPDMVCERAFFPDPEDLDEHLRTGAPLFSLESQRPLTEFDFIGFSVTYEGDYINVLRILRLLGIPLHAAHRRPDEPVILMGGVCAFANPEPMAPFMDFVVVGEGEEIVHEIVDAYQASVVGRGPSWSRREELFERLVGIHGIYLPHLYQVEYHGDGTVAAVIPSGRAPAIVKKRRLSSVNSFQTTSLLRTPNAEYGHMALLEVGKGCGRGCRFCLEGQIYRPVRHRSLESLRETVAQIAKESKRIGLVGACVSDYPWIGDLMEVLEEYDLEVSISSLRADSLTGSLVASLARGGHRTLTVAPEAGTERLRGVIRKAISDEQLDQAVDLIRSYGIPNLKCYFMVGLPSETEEDVRAIPALAESLLRRLRAPRHGKEPGGRLTLSISSYVPKPWTPFQWCPFDYVESLERKLGWIKASLRHLGGAVRVLHESPREAYLQSMLARGDRRVGGFLEVAAQMDGDWRRALKAWAGEPEFYTYRPRPPDETMPWDHFEVGVKKGHLLKEYERAGLAPEPLRVGG